jgi:hypothetical protein
VRTEEEAKELRSMLQGLVDEEESIYFRKPSH